MIKLIIVVILVSIILYIKYVNNNILEGYDNISNCPNLLLKKDDKYYLYNSKKTFVPGINPIQFNNLYEYEKFVKWLRSNGIRCPILYLHQMYDTQGTRTYKIMSDPQTPQLDTDISENNEDNNKSITKLYDAGHNNGSYPGFDPLNQYIGDETPLDKLYSEEEKYKFSDNPMDPNFGGIQYAEEQVNENKYSEDYVYNIYKK